MIDYDRKITKLETHISTLEDRVQALEELVERLRDTYNRHSHSIWEATAYTKEPDSDSMVAPPPEEN